MKLINKICEVCGIEFKPGNYKIKTCSRSCGSKLKFINNPKLIDAFKIRSSAVMKKLNADGKAWRMPPGYHTDEFKKKLSSRMKNKVVSADTRKKISDNHWSTDISNKELIIKKILETREQNSNWNSDERRLRLANYMILNSNLHGGSYPFKRGYELNIFTNELEYYMSGLELEYMKKFNCDSNIKFWTTKHNIKIEYEYKGKIRRYIPDFFIEYKTGEKKILELKGRIFDMEIIQLKNKAAEKYCELLGINYEIIYQ